MSFGACEESGCGEPPKPEKSSTSVSGASGASSGGGGGGAVAVGERAQQVINGPLRKEKDSAIPRAQTARPEANTAVSTAAVFSVVNKAAYERTVVKAPGKVLVVSYTPTCKGWKDVQAALQGLSEDLAGKVAVYRLDVSDPDQATVLPSGMTRLPVPGFAYYESGVSLSQRQGLPFDRRIGKGGEPIEDAQQYQDRLRRWLREAVAAKSFSLPAPKSL